MRSKAASGLTILALMILLMAAGCSGDDDAADSTTTSTVESTAESTTTTTAARTTTTSTTTATTPSAPAGAECILGEWELDSQAFFDSAFAEVQGSLGMEDAAFEHVSGTYRVTMTEDGTFLGDRDEWTFRFTLPEGSFQTIIDGTDTGSYVVAGDRITIGEVVSDTDVTFLAEAGGEVFEVPSGPGIESDALGGEGAFTCSGDTMSVENNGIVSSFNRVG
jgi:hypothetical protein